VNLPLVEAVVKVREELCRAAGLVKAVPWPDPSCRAVERRNCHVCVPHAWDLVIFPTLPVVMGLFTMCKWYH